MPVVNLSGALEDMGLPRARSDYEACGRLHPGPSRIRPGTEAGIEVVALLLQLSEILLY
jgi:hypothetical protein